MEFTATRVDCIEVNDREIVEVTFDSMGPGFDEENRTSLYLMILANFEISRHVQMEYHDGEDYAGDRLDRIQLWQRRVHVVSCRGYEFDIAFELADEASLKLREYLKVLLRSDCFQEWVLPAI